MRARKERADQMGRSQRPGCGFTLLIFIGFLAVLYYHFNVAHAGLILKAIVAFFFLFVVLCVGAVAYIIHDAVKKRKEKQAAAEQRRTEEEMRRMEERYDANRGSRGPDRPLEEAWQQATAPEQQSWQDGAADGGARTGAQQGQSGTQQNWNAAQQGPSSAQKSRTDERFPSDRRYASERNYDNGPRYAGEKRDE